MSDFLNKVDSIGALIREYHGWALRWTGWKVSVDFAHPVGQWLAWQRGGPYFYASAPGGEGSYKSGDQFFLGDGGALATALSGLDCEEAFAIVLLQARLDALGRLKQEIDKYLAAKEEEE